MKTKLAFLIYTLFTSVIGVCQEFSKPESGEPTTAETTTAAPVAGTLPAARSITDLKGRSMVGTIVAKTDTTITFERTADNKKFDIQIDTLSVNDQAFIATLVARGKKSVLLVATASYHLKDSNQTIEELQKLGYKVTIGICNSRAKGLTKIENQKDSTPKVEGLEGVKSVYIMEPAETDSYDIVWVPNLAASDVNKVTIPGTAYTVACLHESLVEIFNQRDAKNLAVVVRCPKTKSKNKEYFNQGIPLRNASRQASNYSMIDGNWIYYSDEKKGGSQNLILDKVINSLGKLPSP